MVDKIIIRATKPEPDSKIGIAYVVEDDGMRITRITETSIFASGELKVGDVVVQIGSSYSIPGKSQQEVGTILASLGQEVTFVVKTAWTFTFKREKKDNGGYSVVTNSGENEVPHFLAGRNVPLKAWKRLYHAFETQLLKSIMDAEEMKEKLDTRMETYVRNQMITGGMIGFGTESSGEKKTFEMTAQVADLGNSAALAAVNVVALANAMMSKHGIMCQLDLQSYDSVVPGTRKVYEGLKVQGIEFISMD